VMSMSPPDFWVAKVCFSVAALLLGIKSAEWINSVAASSSRERLLLSFALFGAIGGLWTISMQWIRGREPINNDAGRKDDHVAVLKMATLFDLFINDFPSLPKIHNEYSIQFAHSPALKIEAQVYLDHDGASKFIGFYIPPSPLTYEACLGLAENYNIAADLTNDLAVISKDPGQIEVDSRDLKFSGRVYLYHSDPLSFAQKATLESIYGQRQLSVQFRGMDYQQAQFLRSIVKH
jgi:hypothetical protein